MSNFRCQIDVDISTLFIGRRKALKMYVEISTSIQQDVEKSTVATGQFVAFQN